MRLSDLLQTVELLSSSGALEVEVSGLACDSRQVEEGFIFCALPGVKVDGRNFIPQAISSGAVAVLTEQLPEDPEDGICYLQVANARLAMAQVAAEYYQHPSKGVPTVGVTGTNGKTTITYQLESVLQAAGYAPAVFGTVEYRFGEHAVSASHTTPESLELLRLMAEYRALGADAFILEVSSHALEQHRVDGINFDVAVFTNLTPEHLDYHQDLESYFASKRRLFSELLGQGKAAINGDDGFGRQLLRENAAWSSFAANHAADVKPAELTAGRDGIRGEFKTPEGKIKIDSGLIGEFNISNLLATVTAAQHLGVAPPAIEDGVKNAPQVPGRLQRIDNDRGILALVDYAHTGDALEQVLKTLTKLEHKRLITLVGCGGDRDPSKRPVMAAAAVQYSDLVVFTSDNPRTEDPLRILTQVRAGAVEVGARELSEAQLQVGERGFVVIPDRREAIDFAANHAHSGDLLLVAGKGHEDYQILGTEKIHFDDREELSRALSALTQTTGVTDV